MKRFISMDPLGYVDSMNMYESFGCDPVNNVDPLGLYINSEEELIDMFKDYGLNTANIQQHKTSEGYQYSLRKKPGDLQTAEQELLVYMLMHDKQRGPNNADFIAMFLESLESGFRNNEVAITFLDFYYEPYIRLVYAQRVGAIDGVVRQHKDFIRYLADIDTVTPGVSLYDIKSGVIEDLKTTTIDFPSHVVENGKKYVITAIQAGWKPKANKVILENLYKQKGIPKNLYQRFTADGGEWDNYRPEVKIKMETNLANIKNSNTTIFEAHRPNGTAWFKSTFVQNNVNLYEPIILDGIVTGQLRNYSELRLISKGITAKEGKGHVEFIFPEVVANKFSPIQKINLRYDSHISVDINQYFVKTKYEKQ